MVNWNPPYNLQRLPVHPEAFVFYLKTFTGIFIEGVNKAQDAYKVMLDTFTAVAGGNAAGAKPQ
jgi:hypothetical protein